MATKKKMLQAAAGNAGSAGLDVNEVFSTYLYDGTGADLTIANGVDLSGEGGMVWLKGRIQYSDHFIYDTERGVGNNVRANKTTAQQTRTDDLKAFNSNGFSLGDYSEINTNYSSGGVGYNYASWTFRKAPKFFDIVTYTGDGTDNRSIAHNLGSVPGCIITKMTSGAKDWKVYHRGLDASNPENYKIHLNETAARSGGSTLFDAPTDTHFILDSNDDVNGNGDTYVAYLFAHNNGDGEFGPSGNADIIKCGSFTTDGSGVADVNLGFEPAWLLTKASSTTSYWALMDEMRGFGADVGMDYMVQPNTSNAEVGPNYLYKKNATGFSTASLSANQTYIYIAIRRGPLAQPESGTEVFDVEFGSASPKPWFKSGFPVDFGFFKNKDATGNWQSGSRLTQGKSLNPNKSQAEETSPSTRFDYQNGWYNSFGASTSWLSWMWKRAPGFFDVVAYTGDGVAGRTVSHNLGVAPEMMWVKRRNATDIWAVYSEAVGNTGFLRLNDTNAVTTAAVAWNDTSPTATDFTLGTYAAVNTSSSTYIAYLFATLPGVSKVGSYTGNGTSQTIGCGFTSGARFILIKRTDSTGDWYVWDTERGIVAGNDPHLNLNTTAAEVTSDDSIDPDNSGFIVNQVSATNINVSSASYIFYAIA